MDGQTKEALVDQALQDLRRFIHHDPRCVADQMFAKSCNCGLRDAVRKVVGSVAAGTGLGRKE